MATHSADIKEDETDLFGLHIHIEDKRWWARKKAWANLQYGLLNSLYKWYVSLVQEKWKCWIYFRYKDNYDIKKIRGETNLKPLGALTDRERCYMPGSTARFGLMDTTQSTYLYHTPVKMQTTAYKDGFGWLMQANTDQRAKEISGIGSAGGYPEAGAKTITPVSPTHGMDAHRFYSSSLTPTIRIDLPPRFSGDGVEDFRHWWRQLEVAVNAGAGESVALVQLLPSCPVRFSIFAVGFPAQWDKE